MNVTNLKITTTEFDGEVFNSEICESSYHEAYVFHVASLYNYINVNGTDLYAEYQTGDEYYHNSYDLPSNSLKLSENSSEALKIIDNLYESDFEDETENANNALEEVSKLLPCIDSIGKMQRLYEALNDNHPINLIHHLCAHSYNPDDYEENENGDLVLK